MNYGKKGVKKKQKALNSKATKWGKKIFLTFVKVFFISILAVAVLGVSAGIGVFKGIIDTAPQITTNDVAPSGFSTFVYDIEGNQTAKLVASNSNRIPVSMSMIPENLANAFVAIEDRRFYEHNGIDLKGILRAGVVFVTSGFDRMEGASTITQQLLKNTVFTEWTQEDSLADSLKRKLQEQYLALEISKIMSKEEVLERYMNTINLGQNTLGVQAASLRYFNKSVSELTLSECAVIASITQNPSKYNPISHPDKNAERRLKCLNHMIEEGFITQEQYDEALADNVYDRIQTVNQEVESEAVNTYFVDALTDEVYEDLLEAGYNETQAYSLLYSGGLKIYSTQDPKIQEIADNVFNNEENYPANVKWQISLELTIIEPDDETRNYSTEMFRTYYQENVSKNFNLLFSSTEEAYEAVDAYKQYIMVEGDEVLGEKISLVPQPQVSLTIADQTNGHVVALIGGRGTKTGSRTLNRATDSVRQPGSTFKVLAAYAPALDSAGLSLASVYNDAPFNYSDGTPVNNWYGEEYRGISSVRTGILDSMNIIAVKTLTQITPQLGYDYLINFGFTTLETSKEINGKIYSDIQQALALGGITNGVKNIELNAAYAAIANGGTYIEPKMYTKVVDREGNVILDNTQDKQRQVIRDTTAYMLTSAMEDVVTRGTGGAVNFGGQAIAGKTGTTSDSKDVWFAGYTPYYTATVWAGIDNPTKLNSGETSLAKKLWKLTMEEIHKDLETKSFERPEGIIQQTVCSRSGKLPIPGLCDATLISEYFTEATVPTESCNIHYDGYVCEYSRQPACELCPFKMYSTSELPLIEDASLLVGNTNEDGTPMYPTSNMCPHNEAFFLDPNYPNILQQHRVELEVRYQEWLAQQNAAAAPQ